MPSSYHALRKKFMNFETSDDGIQEAETLLKECGFLIERGWITRPKKLLQLHTDGDIYDAIDFLCNEWDYAVKKEEE